MAFLVGAAPCPTPESQSSSVPNILVEYLIEKV